MRLGKYNQQLNWMMQIGMVILFFIAIFERTFVVAVGVFINIILSILPNLVRKNNQASEPWQLSFWVTFALLLHTIGVTLDLYHNPMWSWWDNMQHVLGSVVVGMIAFHLVFILNFLGKVTMSIPMIGLFVFLTAMGIGGIWEIMEFYSDKFLHTYAQLSLSETMLDMQFNLLGGSIIAIIAMQYVLDQRVKRGEHKKLNWFGKK